LSPGSGEQIVIYGSRPDGHAKVVLELIEAVGGFECVGCIDDTVEAGSIRLRGLTVLGGGELLAELADRGVSAVALGFGNGSVRADLAERLDGMSLAAPSLVHEQAAVSSSASLAGGCQVLERAVIGPQASLGAGAVAYCRSVIGAGADLDSGVTLAPAAAVGRGARIGRGASIGAAAMVLPGRSVGPGAEIGAGALVDADVGEAATVAGVPARAVGGGSAS
jgi:sugar O-acyltransferase (sialic acid O-acetyltransferase NeuD family)